LGTVTGGFEFEFEPLEPTNDDVVENKEEEEGAMEVKGTEEERE